MAEKDEQICHPQQSPRTVMEFGRFQVLTCIVSFLFMIFHSHIALSGMFLNMRPYNCSEQQQEFDNLNNKSIEDTENLLWSKYQGFESSLSIQYKLCNHETGSFTTVTFFVGTIVGSLIVGPISDMIGRIPCFLIGQLLCSLSVLASNYAPTFWLHLLTRCLGGLFMMFPHCAIQVYGCEVHSPEHRSRFLACWTTGVSFGVVTAGFLGHVTRNPHMYVLISCCYIVVPLLVSVFLPESPAWLAAKGHRERAEVALRRIEIINGRPKSQGEAVSERLAAMSMISSNVSIGKEKNNQSDATSKKRQGWREWNCELLRLTCVLGLYGVCVGMNAYGFYFVMGNIISDVCMYSVLIGATQLPYAFVLNLMPHRPGLIFCGVLSGILVLVFGAVAHFLPDESTVLAVLGVVGCFFGNAAFYVMASVAAECFPTAIRNTGLGLCTFCVRCGSTMSPLINFFPGALLQSILLACPLLLSSVLLGLVLAGVISLGAMNSFDDEQLERKESIELKM